MLRHRNGVQSGEYAGGIGKIQASVADNTQKKRATAAEQAARNEEIVAAKMRGMSCTALARTYGLSRQRITQICAEYREASPSLRAKDPAEIVDELLEGYQADIEELVILAATTQADSVRVAAIKSRMDARGKIADLLQEAGVLPHDLGQIKVEIDARMTAVRVLSILKQHNVSGDVRDALLDAMMERGELEAGDDVIDGEAVE